MARKKGDALKATVSNDDPDSNLKFNLATFPINDLLNSDSFISLYPDVLDIIFFNPEIVEVLKKFETSAGFVCHISSLKEVKLSSWLGTAVTSNKSENEMRATVEFLRKYIETQLFNALLRNTHSDEDTPEGAVARANLDPQEYFDEVASVCAEAIAKSIVPEKVKPQLFNSAVEYSIYPISESVAKNNMLKHVGILVTLAGNIGLEKMGGSLFKKGKINVLVDITLKVVVFNSYIFSKRGLTLILNGIREREKRDRQVMLDEEIERAQNSVDGWSGRRWETEKKDNSLIGKIADLANQKFNDPLAAQVEATATSVTYGLNKQL